MKILRRLTLAAEEAPANPVPAAAVIQGEQTLLGITGHKGHVGGLASWMRKTLAQPGKCIQNCRARGREG